MVVNSARAGAVVDDAIVVGAGAVWMQFGVRDRAAEQRARDGVRERLSERAIRQLEA